MNSRFRILVTDHPWPRLDVEAQELDALGVEWIDAPDASEATLVEHARGVDAMAVCWAQVTDAVLAAAPQCRIVARMGIGLDNIDIAAATRRGMLVTNVPDYCVEEVADHTLALVLACARNVGWWHLQSKRGEYQLAAAPPMRRLTDLTVGLFGLGRIGRRTAVKARGLGLRVIAHNRSGSDCCSGVEMVDWQQLLSVSHFLCLHAPLTDDTRHCINAAALARMQPSAYLINTSRGGLVDENALWEALQANRLAGAALDVFDPEPPDLTHPLFQDERVIATPHAAFVSKESVVELRTRVARQIRAALTGSQPENVINR